MDTVWLLETPVSLHPWVVHKAIASSSRPKKLNLPQMDPNPPHVRCNCHVFNTVWRVDGLRPGFCVLPDKPGGHALLTWGASLLTYYYLRAKPESQ